MKASFSCLWQIFNSRCQFTDIPVRSRRCADIKGRACLVTSPISPEAQRHNPDQDFNMPRQSTAARTYNWAAVIGCSSALNKCRRAEAQEDTSTGTTMQGEVSCSGSFSPLGLCKKLHCGNSGRYFYSVHPP